MKFLLCAIFALISFASPLPAGETLSVISSVCAVYETADFSSPVLDSDGKEILFHHGDKLTFIAEEGDFFQIESGEVKGYVFKFYLTSNKNGQDVYPVFNGSVIASESNIFNIDGTESGHKAKLGQEVFIYGGFDGKKEMTEIAIVLEDGSLFYGLISTKDIKANGISGALITSITIIIALVTIILAVVFIKKSKTKKEKKQTNT